MSQASPVLETRVLSRPPLVLIASGQEWSARALKSVLAPRGYTVRFAHDGRQLARRVHDARPDVLIIEDTLPDVRAVEACRAIRSDPELSPNTPILVTAAQPLAGNARIEALTAGAWDIVALPINAEELVARLNSYAHVKLEADRAREESLLDAATGFYNMWGFIRRLTELTATSMRFRRPIGCIALEPDLPPPAPHVWRGEITWHALSRLSGVVRATVRAGDIPARISRTTIAIAAETNADGMRRLTDRVIAGVSAVSDSMFPLVVRAGYYAEEDLSKVQVEPVEVLARATAALRRSQHHQRTISAY